MNTMNSGSAIGMAGKPWEDKERNGCVAGLLVLAFILLILVALAGLILFISSFSAEKDQVWMLVGGLVALGLSIFLLVILAPQLKVPSAFKPRFKFPPNVLGQIFDVRFQPKQRLSPIGTIQFGPYGLHIEGQQEASTGQVVLLGALLSTAFRKKFTRDIPYSYTSSVEVKGKQVSLITPTEEPNQFIFRVSALDGERLYRELYAHFPNSVAQWAYLFVGQAGNGTVGQAPTAMPPTTPPAS